MTDEQDNTPDWIKKENRAKADRKRREAEQQRHELDRAQSVQDGVPAFWRRLVTQLKNNTDHLKDLDGEHLAGSTSASEGGEWQCHIEVNRHSVSPPPEFSKMNLFYQPGANLIRRTYMHQAMREIRFEPGQNGLAARIDETPGPQTPEQLADFIVKWMAKKVRASDKTVPIL